MPVNVTMPKNGMEMTEGIIMEWYKNEGDLVNEGEELAQIHSGKMVIELESVATGTLAQILYPVGKTVPVFETIAIIAKPGEKIERLNNDIDNKSLSNQSIQQENTVPENKPSTDKVIKATPVAKRIAKEHGINIEDIGEGSGPGGRIKEEDINKYIESLKTSSETVRKTDFVIDDKEEVEYIPLAGFRKVIAQNVRESKDTAVHITSTTEIDLTDLIELNKKLKVVWEKEYGIKPTLNAFFVKAVALSLKEYPILNSSIEDDKIALKKYYNIGLAVSIDDDRLIVPVIRNADRLTVKEIAQKISEFVNKAKEGKILSEDMQGGTFTISNVGPFEVQNFTPVIVQPQSAILGIGTSTERPMFVDGEIKARMLTNFCLTYDHRIIQGVPAAKFRLVLKELLEKPYSLLS